MKKNYGKHIFSLLLFGFNGIVASWIDLSSYEIVLMRTLLGSIFLGVLFCATKQKFTFYRHKKEFAFLCVSGLAMGTSWMFLYEAYAQLGVSVASLCYYCGPVIVMAFAPLVFHEKLTAPKLLGFAAVLCGVWLVNGKAAPGSISHWGILCGLLSAATYAVMVIFNKNAKSISGLENSLWQLAIAFVTVGTFVLAKEGFTLHVAPGSILPILVLGLLNTGVGCYLYFSSIGALPVQTVAVCGYIEPLSAVLFSVLFLKEKLLPLQILGAVLILGGALTAECWGTLVHKNSAG
jgi:drug/metabolite transporter (DMT)-like permease